MTNGSNLAGLPPRGSKTNNINQFQKQFYFEKIFVIKRYQKNVYTLIQTCSHKAYNILMWIRIAYITMINMVESLSIRQNKYVNIKNLSKPSY